MPIPPNEFELPSINEIQSPSFRRALDAVPAGLAIVDRAGAIVLINSAAERMFLYERNQWQGLSLDALVPTELRVEHSDRMAEFFKAPATRSMGARRELTALRRDGTEFPVDIGLNVLPTSEGTLVIAAIVDLTESKRIVTTIREQREHLQAYWEAASEGLITLDESATIEMVNKATERMFGYDRRELVGQSLEVLIPQANRGSHAENVKRYLADPEMRPMGMGLTLYGRKKDGTSFPVEVGLNIARVGERTAVIGFVADITERKRLEEQSAVLGTLVDLHQQISTPRKKGTGVGDFDPLTGLDTRLMLEQEFEKVDFDSQGRYVVIYSIERMQQMRTRFGGQTANRIVIFVSQYIADSLQSGRDRLFRWDDDTFLSLVRRDSNVLRVKHEFTEVCGRRLEYFVEQAGSSSLFVIRLRVRVIVLFQSPRDTFLSRIEQAIQSGSPE